MACDEFHRAPDALDAHAAIAPLVTAAAHQGDRLAQQVCQDAIDSVWFGLQVVAAGVAGAEVPVILVGSVARSTYMARLLGERCATERTSRVEIVEPALSPAAGAVVLGLERVGAVTATERSRIRACSGSKYQRDSKRKQQAATDRMGRPFMVPRL